MNVNSVDVWYRWSCDTLIKCDKEYSHVVFSRHLERKNWTQNIEDFPDCNWRLWLSRHFADSATAAIDCLLCYSISCFEVIAQSQNE